MAQQGIPTFATKLFPVEGSSRELVERDLNALTCEGWNVVGIVQADRNQPAFIVLSRLYGATGVELHAPAVQGVTLEVTGGNGAPMRRNRG